MQTVLNPWRICFKKGSANKKQPINILQSRCLESGCGLRCASSLNRFLGGKKKKKKLQINHHWSTSDWSTGNAPVLPRCEKLSLHGAKTCRKKENAVTQEEKSANP